MVSGSLKMNDFKSMTIKELKAYLRKNQGDTEAFHILMDKLSQSPNKSIYSPEEIDKLGDLINQNSKSS
jgi:arsenate reductase-like glutaredoxin family protein